MSLEKSFCLQINIDIFYKLLVSLLVFWVCIARHAQSNQNNKFVISFQYTENMKYEGDFLPAD